MRRIAVLVAGMCIATVGANAATLPLPASLIALDSDQGQALLFDAEARDDYFPLTMYFVTQVNPAFCGPASIAMILNALDVPRAPSDATAGFGLYDQENVFTERTEAVKAKAAIMKGGMTIDQLGGVLAAHDLKAEVRHAGNSSIDEFRRIARATLEEDDHFVLVNYLRKAMGQETGGHISPLAAYDADTDRFLILDVSRYKYPPIWVEAAALFAAMNTPDSDNDDRTRGYVVVGR